MSLRRFLAVVLVAPLALAAFACQKTTQCKVCTDIVTSVPWTAPETHTYTLTQGGSTQGTVVLSVEASGSNYVLRQRATDAKGDSDEAVVTVDGKTLKPLSGTHTVIDSSEKQVAESTYEDIAKGTCSSGRIVRIKETTYKPPSAAKPDATRSIPMCVPDHAYDNDTSLFTWRTIRFDNSEIVSYVAVLANRGDTQIVTLRVLGQEQIDTALGKLNSWHVDIDTPSGTQHAWFATTPDHRLLRYDNGTSVFEIKS